MPELPEVETVRRGLAELLIGKRVEAVKELESPKSFPNSPSEVRQFLIGAKIKSVERRAKLLVINLDSNYSLAIHLKMTGQMVFVKEGLTPPLAAEVSSVTSHLPLDLSPSARASNNEPALRFRAGHPTDSLIGELPDRSTRVFFELDDGSRLFFNDQRRFGWVKLMPTLAVDELPFVEKLGPEPIDPQADPQEFVRRLSRRQNSMVKPAILDQSVVAGVGNIYADEALWASGIHPETRVKDLNEKQMLELYDEFRKVFELSIEKGGSSSRNYVNAKGVKGSYLDFAKVFQREGKPCFRHSEQEIIKMKVGGRGTHLCPQCQTRSES